MKEIELNIKATTKGIFKKQIVFEIQHGNVTDYAYSMADLVATLLNTFQVTTTELWRLINSIEQKYFKIK